jgi:hypothetical protein
MERSWKAEALRLEANGPTFADESETRFLLIRGSQVRILPGAKEKALGNGGFLVA